MAARRARELTPLDRAERTEVTRRMALVVQVQERLLWDLVAGWMDTGCRADDLAGAVGLSRRAFYARLAAHRKGGPT